MLPHLTGCKSGSRFSADAHEAALDMSQSPTASPCLGAERERAEKERAELQGTQALPKKSWGAIKDQASVLGIARSTWYNTSDVPRNRAWVEQHILPRIRGAYPEFRKTVSVAWKPFGSSVLNLYDIYNVELTDIVKWANVNVDKNFTDTSRRFHVPIRPFKIRY
jgi:hypothetical protein